MEAFLSTLPPYVHKFLDKHPATDVFNLLRELICFAVLYSEDRERIKAATDEFLVKREKEIKQEVEEQVIQEEEEEEEEETVAVVEEPKQIVADAVVPEIPVTEKPKMPNTFPQWWGHQEFQHSDRNVAAEKKVTAEKKITAEPITRTSTLWVSFDEEKEKPVKRLSNQVVIPNLRSYDEPTPKNQPMKEAKQQEGSPKPQRAPSVMKSPKQNATVRARAEHAKQLQQEMLKKKTTSESSPTSQRLKQRASSGIDWDTIKRERRKTVIPETQK